MNHAGEIRTLVGIAEPDVRVWTNVGDAHMGFFASPDAIADAKAEILEQARPTDLLVANADDAARGRTSRLRSSARRVTFGTSSGPTSGHMTFEHRGLDGMAATLETPRGPCALRNAAPRNRATCSTCSPPPPSRSSSTCRPTAIAARAKTMKPAPHRGELLRLPGGITPHRRLLQLEPGRASAIARDRRGRDRQRAQGRDARRDARAGRACVDALHAACGRAAAEAGLDLLITVGGEPRARACRRCRSRRACRAPVGDSCCDERRGGGSGADARCARATSSSSRARAASAPTWSSTG